jgi:NaMN:DMB phosphoribosyltransferase
VDAGATLLVPSPPQADDICARAAIAVLCHRDAAATTHQPHGMTDRDWTIRCAHVRDDIARLMPFRGEPQVLLTELADAAVSSMVGALLSASCRRTPSLISGTRAWAAAVIADRLSPAASTWWRAASTSPDPADALARERTDVCPGLPLDIDSADDSAARATIALLDVALSS